MYLELSKERNPTEWAKQRWMWKDSNLTRTELAEKLAEYEWVVRNVLYGDPVDDSAVREPNGLNAEPDLQEIFQKLRTLKVREL